MGVRTGLRLRRVLRHPFVLSEHGRDVRAKGLEALTLSTCPNGLAENSRRPSHEQVAITFAGSTPFRCHDVIMSQVRI
jgi:hypothetical protein